MALLIGLACLALFIVLIVQLGKITELASVVRSDDNTEFEANNLHAGIGLVFMVVFLVASVASFIYYQPYMLGYGPNEAASIHGKEVDSVFNTTLIVTSIVFFLTQFLLFFYAWKFRGTRTGRAKHWAHDDRLEMIWMIAPAIVLTFLVIGGLQTWNMALADVEEGEEFLEIEATGYQFGWQIRYPGTDGKLGTKNFRKITGNNAVGMDFADEKTHDDFLTSETFYLPVDKKVRVRITSRDVLHNFYLPQFRVKMDAVPGMPTRFVFTPVLTTEEKRIQLSELPEWQTKDEDGVPRWKTFDYELACAELCGNGHYSMRKVVKIVSQEEYDAWLTEQKPLYATLNPAKEVVTVVETETEVSKAEDVSAPESENKAEEPAI